jgi:2-polyprenyl-3-methyl-5-hydroxy-6-metoxy-1,4-benzoquinol methylase
MSTVLAAPSFDTTRAEAFSARMLDILNSGALSLMTSIGHQTGLFDALGALPPSTSQEVAEAAKLDERYVREWLAAMAVGKILDYDRATKRYSLPLEHAGVLTRDAGTDNLAFFAQYIPLFAEVEQGIVDCFRNGGGLAYSAFPRFQSIQAEETARVYDASLVERILPIAPDVVERLHTGIDVADIGTGCGHAVNVMARAFPNSSFTGYDFSNEGIAAARAEARRMGLTNARFEIKDVAALDVKEAYDLITVFDAIHDQVKPREVLARIKRALRSEGAFFMADIAAETEVAGNLEHPLGPLLYTISCMHCMTVSLAHGGEGLGAMWGKDKAVELLRQAGFHSIDVRQAEGDPMNNYFVCRKG